MIKLRIAALTALLALSPGTRAAEPSTGGRLVLVLELRNKLKEAAHDKVDASYLADLVRAGIRETAPRLRVTTRENIADIAAAHGRKLEDLEDQTELQTARLLGAEFVVSGVVLQVDTGLVLTLRLHEQSSGQLLAGAAARGTSADELGKAVPSAVAKLLAPIKDLRDPGAPVVGGSCRTALDCPGQLLCLQDRCADWPGGDPVEPELPGGAGGAPAPQAARLAPPLLKSLPRAAPATH
jgi:hypothetical protein